MPPGRTARQAALKNALQLLQACALEAQQDSEDRCTKLDDRLAAAEESFETRTDDLVGALLKPALSEWTWIHLVCRLYVCSEASDAGCTGRRWREAPSRRWRGNGKQRKDQKLERLRRSPLTRVFSLQLQAARKESESQFAHVMELSATLENRLRILEHTVLSLEVLVA
jgi:hypothetical protein